jgi:hypothetical protein
MALCVVLLAVACSSSSSTPAPLGDCTSSPDAAACGPPPGGGGGGGSSGGGGGDSGGGTNDDAEPAGSCGAAGSLLNATNNQCLPCITASCCLASTACTGQCLQLVTCGQSATGINSCEASYPQGVTGYNDLSACIAQSCTPQCPTLAMSTSGDI